ncbi:unknown protein [Parachlamydia acanthamoebae UV-7]|jgi:hypothetical protein|uniref:Uncharacterized protein n=1 Tax=Parachlamydia acanthamoebae (strain UV7) TaxID=765952 RepID=F8L2L3_PARAV|nr:unknown protein [Parachlamydia acanthamoebae UV-7]
MTMVQKTFVKSDVRQHEQTTGGVLIIDDATEENLIRMKMKLFIGIFHMRR